MSTDVLNRSSIVGVMWKTVSEACNLSCDYCYYSRCKGKPGQIQRIEDHVLEKFIKEYMAQTKGVASFAWQGGEPLLAGLDFFKKVVYFQAKYAPPHTSISNAIQTNGTLIDQEWAQFFKKYNFLVGVSMDGPKEINDARRKKGSGSGSYDSIMRGIQYLKEYQVDFNILTVIHETNVTKGKELMKFYEENGFTHVQFIPCMDFKSQNIHEPGTYVISPKEYGDFLCEVFDEWYNGGNPKISERFFDNMLSVYLHYEPELCIHQKTCPTTLILEQNGDAYPCDFFINEEFRLGNVATNSLDKLVNHENMKRFQEFKPNLPKQCQSCEFLQLCNGGCPRNRVPTNVSHESSSPYFCESFKKIYRYADEKMKEIALNVKKRDLTFYIQAGNKVPGRNDACLCGSGKKFKKCCEPLLEIH